MWLAYNQGHVGLRSQFGSQFRLPDWYNWAVGIDQATIELAFNLTNVQKILYANEQLFRIANDFQSSAKGGLTGVQPYYMSLEYVGPTYMLQNFNQTLAIADYVNGITYMEKNVAMEKILAINDITKNTVSNVNLQKISETYHETTAEQFSAIHGLSAEQLTKVQNKTTSGIESRYKLFIDYITVEALVKFAINDGKFSYLLQFHLNIF